jgi:hypothetical protein
VQAGLFALLAGVVALLLGMEQGAGAEITTVPMLLAGLGIGALASQLGSVTVSSVPEEESGEVGGLQNTGSNLGTSIGTALVGSILIATLTASFLQGFADNPDVSAEVSAQAEVELADGIPFVSDDDLEGALQDAGVEPDVAAAAVEENEEARLVALRVSLATIALVLVVALFFARAIPTVQAADELTDEGAAPVDR